MQPIAENAAAKITLCTVAATYLSALAIVLLTDISVDLASVGSLAGIVAFLVPFGIYARWRRMVALPAAFDCAAALFATIPPLLLWTYAAMRINMPLADAELAAMDAALGFDWLAFVAFVDARPTLARVLAWAYSSFAWQLLLLPVLLAVAGRSTRAYAMFFAYVLVCFVSSIVCIWYPSLGAYVTYDLGPGDVSNINAWFGFFFLEQFHAVRAEGPFIFVFNMSAGIVTFPSVHAAGAAVCAWAAWDVRLLRYPVLVLNVAMAASAISHGAHYLVDIVAGIGIAGLCVSVATLVFYRPATQRSPLLAAVSRRTSSLAAVSG